MILIVSTNNSKYILYKMVMFYSQNCAENYANLQCFDEFISFTELTIILILSVFIYA